MSFTDGFHRVLAKGLEDYTAPITWNIEGIKITYKPSPVVSSGKKWKPVLEEWLPRFNEVGWLNNFNRIYIGTDITPDETVGQYNHNGTIDLAADPNISWGGVLVVGDDRESVLIHEFIHHAHLTINGFEGSFQPAAKSSKLKQDVSNYAGENIGEAIAEIGVGLTLGAEFPRWVHEYYAEHDGPQEVYDLRHG